MQSSELIREIFAQSLECITSNCEHLSSNIELAAALISSQLLEGGKVFCCGNGGGASDAQYFTSRLINRFDRERPALPAFCLSGDSTTITTIANDQNFNDIYSKQLRSLANSGDILVVISTSGKSSNLVQAVQAAHEKQMYVIVLSGNDGGVIDQILGDSDIELRVQSENTARIKEINLLTLHCICELIDQNLFGENI
jgi:D-sedoheptulose 7-phosphate isomerase